MSFFVALYFTIYHDKKGKLSEEKVFKGLTKEEKKLDYDYERDDRDDKKLSFLGDY